MNKVAEFVYWLNRTKPPTDIDGVFVGVWDAGKVRAQLLVKYTTEIRLGVMYEEIRRADDVQALVLEVAGKMVEMYREKMALPLFDNV